jgi:inorganic phosphate transporter, PiT family
MWGLADHSHDGQPLTDIAPPQGFAAKASSTAVILSSAHLGFALSTTHVVAGSVLGSGLGRRLAQVRWSWYKGRWASW